MGLHEPYLSFRFTRNDLWTLIEPNQRALLIEFLKTSTPSYARFDIRAKSSSLVLVWKAFIQIAKAWFILKEHVWAFQCLISVFFAAILNIRCFACEPRRVFTKHACGSFWSKLHFMNHFQNLFLFEMSNNMCTRNRARNYSNGSFGS